MACPAFFQDLGRHAFPIVPNPQLYQVLFINDPGLNVICPAVSDGIAQRLASNSIDLVTNNRMQVSSRTLHHETEGRSPFCNEFVPQSAERIRQIVGGCG